MYRWLSHTTFMLCIILYSMQQYASLFQTVAQGMCWGDWEGINFVGLNFVRFIALDIPRYRYGLCMLCFKTVNDRVRSKCFPGTKPNGMNSWSHTGCICINLIKVTKCRFMPSVPTTWWTDKNNLTDKWIPIPKSPLLHIQKFINWLYNEFHAKISRMGLKTPGN